MLEISELCKKKEKKSVESPELCEKVRKTAKSAEMCGEWQILRKCAEIPHPPHLGLTPAKYVCLFALAPPMIAISASEAYAVVYFSRLVLYCSFI